MTHIPQSDILSTTNLSRVFNSTTATYKFYRFQNLLQMHNEEGAFRMNVWDLVIRMVANAWFPIHYFHLSFGSMDSLHKIVTELQWITALLMDARREDVVACLKERLDNKEVKKLKAAGFQPVMVVDAVASRREADKKIAIERAIQEGILVTTAEAVLFELTLDSTNPCFKAISKLVK